MRPTFLVKISLDARTQPELQQDVGDDSSGRIRQKKCLASSLPHLSGATDPAERMLLYDKSTHRNKNFAREYTEPLPAPYPRVEGTIEISLQHSPDVDAPSVSANHWDGRIRCSPHPRRATA